MSEINELERRITAALERIGRGIDRMQAAAVAPVPEPDAGQGVPAPPPAPDEISRLQSALEDEKAVNAQLAERLRALKERGSHVGAEAETRVEAMTRQLDVQGIEMQRMRRATTQLREQVRALRQAAAQSVADPHLINKVMLAELEAMRTTRASETAEMDEILAELAPLLPQAGPSMTEVQADA